MKPLLPHTRRPDITFNRDGRILITSRLARLLDLHPGHSLAISVDDGEYLLHAFPPPASLSARRIAVCSPTKAGSRNYRATSVRLARALLDANGISYPRVSYTVGDPFVRDGIAYIPIITHNPLL